MLLKKNNLWMNKMLQNKKYKRSNKNYSKNLRNLIKTMTKIVCNFIVTCCRICHKKYKN